MLADHCVAFGADTGDINLARFDVCTLASENRKTNANFGGDVIAETWIAMLIGEFPGPVGMRLGAGQSDIRFRLGPLGVEGCEFRMVAQVFALALRIDREDGHVCSERLIGEVADPTAQFGACGGYRRFGVGLAIFDPRRIDLGGERIIDAAATRGETSP